MPQTTFSRSFSAAFAGQLGDEGSGHRSISALNGEAGNVQAGVFVCEGAEGKFLLPALSTDKLKGAVINTFARNPGDQAVQLSSSEAILSGNSANLLESGRIWMVCEEAMAIGDDVYMRYSANGAGKTQLGAVRNDADTAHARKVYGARVIRASSGAGVVLLEVDVNVDRASV